LLPGRQSIILRGAIRRHAARPHPGDSGFRAANTRRDFGIAKSFIGKSENLLSGGVEEAFGHGRRD
jgi:hypothetical protein